MAGSEDARLIDEAHKSVRAAIGKPWEALAREYLRVVVDKVKRRQAQKEMRL